MSRYIDADALIERILKLKVVTDDMYGMGIARGIERAETAIEMQPTADVVEVRHGHWIEHIEKPSWLEDDVEVYYNCSECGTSHWSIEPPYCPECGAKMDGEERK